MPRTDILERKDEILEWIRQEQPKNYISQQLHCKQETLNHYLKKMGIDYKGQAGKNSLTPLKTYRPANYYFDNNHKISSDKLKKKLFKDKIKEEKCEICGVSFWQNKKLPLELHHIDGNHFNNNLNNLQILCPNCHSIQPNNCGKNIGKYADILELEQRTGLDPVED